MNMKSQRIFTGRGSAGPRTSGKNATETGTQQRVASPEQQRKANVLLARLAPSIEANDWTPYEETVRNLPFSGLVDMPVSPRIPRAPGRGCKRISYKHSV